MIHTVKDFGIVNKAELVGSLKIPLCMCVCAHAQWLSCPTLATPWTIARQTPLSLEFSRQEYWSGLPFPYPGDLPDPRIKPVSPESSALAGRFFTTEPHGKPITPFTQGSNSSPSEFLLCWANFQIVLILAKYFKSLQNTSLGLPPKWSCVELWLLFCSYDLFH